ncbi:hypothetical protein JB92DRAFT_2971532, partial [Gautieria morchelliformis]
VSTLNLSTYCSISTCKNNDVLKCCAKCKIIWHCSSICCQFHVGINLTPQSM